MSETFEIECVQGIGATVYIATGLEADSWRDLQVALDRLPAEMQVFRLQLVGDTRSDLPEGLGDIVRHWRKTRRRPVHLMLVPTERPKRSRRHAVSPNRYIPDT